MISSFIAEFSETRYEGNLRVISLDIQRIL